LSALVATLGALIATLVVGAAPLAQSQPSLTVYAGQGSGVLAEQDFIGDPVYGGSTVRVVQGTTVNWTPLSDEPHTVTFPAGQPIPDIFIPQPEGASRPGMFNPRVFLPSLPTGPWDGTTYISAELPTDVPTLSVTFTQLGRYNYVCLYHMNMKGSVEVVAPGTTGITTQSAVESQAAAMDAMRQAQAAEIYATRDSATRVEGPRGADLWFVRAGTDARNDSLDIEAFLPGELTIGQGDTVAWYVDHLAPHTVTFRPAPDVNQPADLFVLQLPDGTVLPPPTPGEAPPPEVLAAFENPETAPRLVFGPGAIKTSNPIYDGRSLYTSGFIGEHPRISTPMDKVWALTFNTPGSFQYVCLLHEELGMKGTINVQAR
jgi:plastocyanin